MNLTKCAINLVQCYGSSLPMLGSHSLKAEELILNSHSRYKVSIINLTIHVFLQPHNDYLYKFIKTYHFLINQSLRYGNLVITIHMSLCCVKGIQKPFCMRKTLPFSDLGKGGKILRSRVLVS